MPGGLKDGGGEKGGGIKTSKADPYSSNISSGSSSANEAFGYSTSLSLANDGSYNIITGKYEPELAVLFEGEF